MSRKCWPHSSASHDCQESSPSLRLPLDSDFDMSPAFQPLVARLPKSSGRLQAELFFKLCLLHSARADELQDSSSSWIQRALLGRW